MERERRVRSTAQIKHSLHDAAKVMAKAEHKKFSTFLADLTEQAIESRVNLLATIPPRRHSQRPATYNNLGGNTYVR